MNAMNILNLVLWGVQGFLALFFLAAGAPKLIGRGIERWTGFSDVPGPLVVFIGCTEVLGAAGLVLPLATGVLPWLTPLAAVGLAIIVLMAAGFHVRADERLNAIEAGLWASIAAVIAIGRWDRVVASHAYAGPWGLGAALGPLGPSGLIQLLRRRRRVVEHDDVDADCVHVPAGFHHGPGVAVAHHGSALPHLEQVGEQFRRRRGLGVDDRHHGAGELGAAGSRPERLGLGALTPDAEGVGADEVAREAQQGGLKAAGVVAQVDHERLETLCAPHRLVDLAITRGEVGELPDQDIRADRREAAAST